MTARSITVGFFSPLPPSPTGVADYSAVLLEALRKHGRVDVDAERCDVALYHIGNNHLHRAIYQRALLHPGVTVLHDAVLHHFFLGTLSPDDYASEFVHNYGEWMRGLATELWANRARSAADPRYFEYAMVKRIAETSRAIIVHNPGAAAIVKRHAPSAHVIEIPHLSIPASPPDNIETLRLRDTLGIGPRTLLAGVFGHLRESKRLTVILRAMERAWSAGADVKLLVQGEFASSDLKRATADLPEHPRILRVGYLDEPDFWRYAAATDVCLNLRHPTAGETSGIAIRMMAIGKPVIFTAGEEVSRFPEDVCLRVDLGAQEEEMLAGYLVWLATEREAGVEIGRRAMQHIAEHHAIERVTEQYWDVLRKS
ncbi:MAG TPA: glycosyltransferase family 4 protein [Bryobacteraceae bacterium]|jgi:glycosyltransferase involved in cell wall biosynthesis|nr:glycosyltransferase family 4 protein [Bryobacteraceae bacterium]